MKFFLVVFLCMASVSLRAQAVFEHRNPDSLRQLLLKEKDDTAKVALFEKLSYAYAFAFEDSAVIYGEQGVQLARKIGFPSGEGRCMWVLSLAFAHMDQFRQALDYGSQAVKIFEKLRDTAMLATATIVVAICYRDQENYKEAIVYGHKAIKLSELTRVDSTVSATCYGITAGIYERMNRLDSALYFAEKGHRLNPSWSGVILTLGNIYSKQDNYRQALDYYREGLSKAALLMINIDLVDINYEISKIFQSEGQIDSSIYYASKAISEQSMNTYPEGVLHPITQLSNLYALKGNKDSVIKYQKLAISLNNKLFNREKTRDDEEYIFNEKIRQQELASQEEKNLSRIRILSLLGVVIIILIILFLLWRSNIQKQKSKQEIEKAYSELKSTQAQLVQSEKMASLGELTAGIAHEIQNPLNFVNNFSDVNTELLKEMNEAIRKGNYDEAKSIADTVITNEEKINHHGKRADSIVKGMLQHSRTSSGQKEPTDINALAEEYVRLAYHGLRAKDKSFNAKFETDFDSSIGKINIVPQDIGRVLLNLINNAFYAVNKKRETANPDYEPTLKVSTKKTGNWVEIKVRDNGNGIPKKALDKIFQPFFTTKPTGEGTGLGLSLAYDVIKAHDGKIKVDTNEGTYTEFILHLPITSASSKNSNSY